MRDAIKGLAKAAVTGLVKPDDLVVEAGRKAIDLLFSWLPGREKTRLEGLIEEVAVNLQELADKEFAGDANLDAAIGNATTPFEQHGLSGRDLVALNLDASRATETLLKRGKDLFEKIEEPVADLCQRYIIPQVVGRLLADRQLVEELKAAITGTVLARLDEIRQIVREQPRQRVDVDGQGNIVVQVIGYDNRIDLGRPYLRLTRYLTRRVDPAQRSDAELLSPYSRSIPLVGRHEELAELRVWLASDKPISIRVLTGRAGAGKTRLALELCEEMFELGWAAGFVESGELVRFQDRQSLAAWDWERPTLLVIDYAAVHAVRLNAWFTELADHAGTRKPLRILLLERHADVGTGWWQTMTEVGWGSVTVARLFDPPEPLSISALRLADSQRAILASTFEAMGSAIRPPLPNTAPDFDRQLAEITWGGDPLFLMMAGMLAAQIGFDRVLALSRTDLAFDIVTLHELPRLRKFGGGNESKAAMLVHMAAYVTLCRGLNYEDLLVAVEEEKAALQRDAGDAASLAETLGIALPGADSAIAPILPDVIGEAAILKALSGPQAAGKGVVERAFQHGGQQVAATVIRTAQDFAGEGQLEPLEWLDALIEHGSVDVDRLMMIVDTLPPSSIALAEHGARITATLARTLRGEVVAGAEYRRPHLAATLVNLAMRFGAVGQRQEALASAQEAVDLYRALADKVPDAYRPPLAMALNNLASSLNAVGQREAALAAAQQAADLYRALAAKEPDIYRPEFALALNNLANGLSAVGRRQEALAPAQEAVDIYSELANKAPDSYRPRLAMALNNLANRLSEIGQRQAALAPAQEAVAIRRELAAKAPDAFRPYLANGLNTLALRLSEVGRHQEALGLAREAETLYRALTDKTPAAYRSGLALTLRNLSNCLSALREFQEAFRVAEEAAHLYRALAEAAPDAYCPELARALNTLAVRLNEVGPPEAALAPAKEAADLYRDLATKSDAYRPTLAWSLNNLSALLSAVGQPQAALAPAREAAKIYRTLAAKAPDAYRPALAGSLNNLANSLSGVGQRQEALRAAQQAADLYHELAAKAPDAYRPDLAGSLNNLAIRLSEVGQPQEALAQAKEAADLYHALADKAPDVYRPGLAWTLNNLAIRLDEVGQRQQALAPAQEAVAIRRELAAKAPAAYRPVLASALTNLANHLSAVGQRQEALASAQEAADLYRALVDKAPDTYRPSLAGSLSNLANRLEENGNLMGAVEQIQEAIEIYRPYFLAQPPAFVQWMVPMCQQYIERCRKLGREPDAELLTPIAEALRGMSEHSPHQERVRTIPE